MAESAANILELSFDEINAMKKKDLVSKIEKLKGKVLVDSNIKNPLWSSNSLIRKSRQTYWVEWKT